MIKGETFMNKITVKNIEINVTGIEDDDFISLTDIARFKNEEDPNAVIANWIRRVDSLQYLTIWSGLTRKFKVAVFSIIIASQDNCNAFNVTIQTKISTRNLVLD